MKDPMELVRMSLDEKVFIKLRGGREIHGKLHAYDQHMNLLLEDVKEEVLNVEINEMTGMEMTNMIEKKSEILFVRGDLVILLTPSSSFTK